MALDYNTTLLIFAVILLIIAVLYTFTYVYNKKDFKGLGWLALGAGSLVGVLMTAVIDRALNLTVLEITTSLFFIGAPMLFYRGLRKLLSKTSPPLWLDLSYLSLSFLVVGGGTLFDESNLVRTIFVLSSVIALNSILASLLLRSSKYHWKNPATVAGLAYILLVVSDLFRLVNTIYSGNYNTEFENQEIFIFFTILQATMYILLAFAILLMINYRLQMKQAELVKDKVLLNREIQHRVKNNLNLILGLLQLQKMKIANEDCKNILNTSISRIHAIGALYNTLHLGGSVENLSAKDYLTQILLSLKDSLGLDTHEITLENQIEDLSLSATQGISLGLVINEAVTNSVKYAFTQQNDKLITVSLYSKNHTQATLKIRDNGNGLPSFKTMGSSPSLGMTLITDLARQLEGELEYGNDHGAQFILTFPLEPNTL